MIALLFIARGTTIVDLAVDDNHEASRVIMMMRKVFLGVLLCNWEQIFNENFETLGHLIMYLKI